MKILARFFYLSAFLLLPLTGVILAGFFFSRQWLEDLTAAADVATMNSATLKLSMRSSLFYPFAPSAFADYDSSALCPKYSSPCSPALAKLLPGHTVFLTGSCAFDWYPDPALSCCPGGYRCFLGGPVAELEMPICGLLQEGSNVSLQVSPAQVSRCWLLLGLADQAPRSPPPLGSTPTSPPGLPLPSSERRSASGLQRQAIVLAQFPVVRDFFQTKLVDGFGLASFIGLGIVTLIVIIDFVIALCPAQSYAYYRLPGALRPTASSDELLLSLTCASFFSLAPPYIGNGSIPQDALRYFAAFRTSVVCLLLLVPLCWALASGYFDTGDWYAMLSDAGCFVGTTGHDSVPAMFAERHRYYVAMKVCIGLLMVLLLLRVMVFYLAARFYSWLHSSKVDRADALSGFGDDTDDYQRGIDDDDDEGEGGGDGGDRRGDRVGEASSSRGAARGAGSVGLGVERDFDPVLDVYHPPRPSAYKSRCDSDYESDRDDPVQEDLFRRQRPQQQPRAQASPQQSLGPQLVRANKAAKAIEKSASAAESWPASGVHRKLYNKTKGSTANFAASPPVGSFSWPQSHTDNILDLDDLDDDLDIDVDSNGLSLGSGAKAAGNEREFPDDEFNLVVEEVVVVNVANARKTKK